MNSEHPEIYDFDDLSSSFSFDTDDAFAFDFEQETQIESRIIKPPKAKDKTAFWKNATATARKIDVTPGMNYFAIIDGSFIFGDLIEALMVGKGLRAYRLDIHTLSLSQDNVDSLSTLLTKGYIKELNILVSTYFFSHESRQLVPYIYEQLDLGDRFQLAVCDVHTKIITAHLTNGIKLVIHGSANLRSSGNIEQIAIQDSPEIYDFTTEMADSIIKQYKTINKSIRRNILWQTVSKKPDQQKAEKTV